MVGMNRHGPKRLVAIPSYGTHGQIRTDTISGLSRLPLPVGVREHLYVGLWPCNFLTPKAFYHDGSVSDIYGTPCQIRTDTVAGLSRTPLPVGLREHSIEVTYPRCSWYYTTGLALCQVA